MGVERPWRGLKGFLGHYWTLSFLTSNLLFQNWHYKTTIQLPCSLPIITTLLHGYWKRFTSSRIVSHWLLKWFTLNGIVKHQLLKWFKLVKLSMVMILTSMQDKKTFSNLSFMNNNFKITLLFTLILLWECMFKTSISLKPFHFTW